MNNGDSSLSEYSKFRTITGEKRFTDIENIQWSGRTVWEYQHPTFVSHSRKAFLIAPRKTGHSTLRFALAEQATSKVILYTFVDCPKSTQ